MSIILSRQRANLIFYALSIVEGTMIGLLILLGLPLKWMIAIFLAICFSVIVLMVHNVERVLLFCVALIIPFHVGAGLPPILTRWDHIGQWRSLDIQLIDILVLSLLLSGLLRLVVRRGKFYLHAFITVPAVTWLLAGVLSAINTREVDLVAIQMGETVKFFLMYIVTANSIRDKTDIKWVLCALLLGSVFQGLLGVYQGMTGQSLGLSFLGEPAQSYFGRSQGTVGHPNSYAVYLATTLPMAFTILFLEVRGLYKVLAGLTLCAGTLGLLFSLSRSGWLGFAVASLAVLAFAIYRKRQGWPIRFNVSIFLTLLLLVLGLSQRDLIIDRLTSSQATASAFSRITMAEGAIAMIRDYPITGVGANNYSLLMPEYDPFDFKRENQIVIVHNVYLLTAAETGLIGLAAFLWFLISLLVQAVRNIGRAPNKVAWLAGVGAFSGLIALFVHGIVEYDMLANVNVFGLFWLFAAIIASLGIYHKRGQAANDDYQFELSQVISREKHND